MATCIYCLQGLEEECINDPKCDIGLASSSGSESDRLLSDNSAGSPSSDPGPDALLTSAHSSRSGPGRPRKADEDVQDISTGRRRANTDDPIDKASACEWRGLANCGGGKHPIVGCTSGLQEHTHHGPDKNVLNNARSNRHKICTLCHNRWHTANDGDYDPTRSHSPITQESFIEQYYQLLKWYPALLGFNWKDKDKDAPSI